MYDLSIKKDKRSTKFFQKGLRNGEISKTKKIASFDISQECGEGRFYSRNYLGLEFVILQLKNYWIEIVPLM